MKEAVISTASIKMFCYTLHVDLVMVLGQLLLLFLNNSCCLIPIGHGGKMAMGGRSSRCQCQRKEITNIAKCSERFVNNVKSLVKEGKGLQREEV